MSMEIIYEPRDRKSIFAIAGGKNPIMSFQEMEFTHEQLDVFISREEQAQYLNVYTDEYWGSLSILSSLYAIFSIDKPLILYTAEGGVCDTCLEIFLKYGEGQRPNLDEVGDTRNCMDNYDGNIKEAAKKLEKLMSIMFQKKLYEFEHCFGVMGDLAGNFTWDRYQNQKYLPCASPMAHQHMTSNGLNVIALIASQSAEVFLEKRVEFYRQQIRSGKRF